MMVLQITDRTYKSFDVPFDFPLYRRLTVTDAHNGYAIYWKFESHTQVTRITERMSETAILTWRDEKADFVRDMITSEDMLFGRGGYDIILEKTYDSALNRLIDLIQRS